MGGDEVNEPAKTWTMHTARPCYYSNGEQSVDANQWGEVLKLLNALEAKAAALDFTEAEMQRYAGLLGTETSRHLLAKAALDDARAALENIAGLSAQSSITGILAEKRTLAVNALASIDSRLKGGTDVN